MNLILAALLLISSTAPAQTDGQPIGACNNLAPQYTGDSLTVFVDGDLPFYFDVYAVDEFLALEGTQVRWLGYAPRWASEYWLLERQGIQYGFEGVNMDLLGDTVEIWLANSAGKLTERYTATAYDDGEYYFVTKTTNFEYSRSDGTALDYHIEPYPSGGACMWWVSVDDLAEVGVLRD